jgi:flagellar basal-body rod modification protein FlgD
MNVSSASSISTQNVGATKQTETQNALGKDAFLRILVTQLKNQNPLEPLKDTEFIGQMAQFSSLEQLTNLNQAMSQFIRLQGNQALTEHADLLGNTVYWEQEIDGQFLSGEGIVKALALKNGELMVELENEEISVPVAFIHRIERRSETES